MKKNIIIMLLFVSTVALAILHVRKPTTPQVNTPLSQDTVLSELGGQPSADTQEIAELKKELADKALEIHTLRDQLAVVLAQGSQSPSTPKSTAPMNKPGNELSTGLQALIEKLVDGGLVSPQQGRTPPPTLKEKYADLIDSLRLSDDASDRFIALLKESNKLSPAAHRQAQKDIRAFLGDEAYAEYKEYERTMPARLFVDDLATHLAEAGYPLTENQAEAMLKLDPNIVSKVPLSYSPVTITLQNLSGNDVEDMIDATLDESAEMFDRTIANVEDILTKEQMNAMDQYLGERFQETEIAASTANMILPEVINKEFLRTLGSGGSNINTSITIMPIITTVGADGFSNE